MDGDRGGSDRRGPSIPVPCKFFLEGCCTAGSHCRFQHNLRDEETAERNSRGGLARPIFEDFVRPTEHVSECSNGFTDADDGALSFSDVYASLFDGESSSRAQAYEKIEHRKSFADIVSDVKQSNSAAAPRGSEVRHRHDYVPQYDVSDILCSFHMNHQCRYSEDCRYTHGNQCPACGKNVLHPVNLEQAEQHFMKCATKQRYQAELNASGDVECGICYEKPVALGRKFGLLQNCDHAFCLECIREWRGNTEDFGTAVRQCPLCRVESYVVIPSKTFIADPVQREEIFDQYKSKLSTIPCKHFDYGDGECPFSTSGFHNSISSLWPPRAHQRPPIIFFSPAGCLYAHRNREGKDLKDQL